MRFKKGLVLLAIFMICFTMVMAPAAFAKKKKNPLAAWKPKFDPSGAKYVMKVSNVSHPVLVGVGVGYKIRDALWKKTNGQVYFDYYPLCLLGGEVEVLNQLVTGAVQGMACSSVAVTNMAPRMGIVNLPFLVDTFANLDKFIANKKLYQHFLDGMLSKGVYGIDVVGYGTYGWATINPVKTLADAKKVKFRVAEAAVNRLSYKVWGLNAVVMPWPDVPVALKQHVITGLDHTATVCYITKKFEVCKNYTELNYAQGLFIYLINKKWLDSLPKDLQKVIVDTIREECAKGRKGVVKQQEDSIKAAKTKAGVKFWKLPEKDMAWLKKRAILVHQKYAKEIGPDYLKAVQDYLGFKH